VARKRIRDAEAAIPQELKRMTTAESSGATTRKPEVMLDVILNAIGDTLSDLASSNADHNGDEEEDEEEDTELGKLSDEDKPCWVMGKISKTVQHHIESIRQKEMRPDELMQPG